MTPPPNSRTSGFSGRIVLPSPQEGRLYVAEPRSRKRHPLEAQMWGRGGVGSDVLPPSRPPAFVRFHIPCFVCRNCISSPLSRNRGWEVGKNHRRTCSDALSRPHPHWEKRPAATARPPHARPAKGTLTASTANTAQPSRGRLPRAL